MALSVREFNSLLSRISYDKKAFVLLYKEYYPGIVLHIKSVYPRANAEDIAQDFFIRLINRKSTEYVKNPAAWIYTSCRNIVKSKYGETKEIPTEDSFESPGAFIDYVDIDDRMEVKDAIRDALVSTDKVSQKLFVLHYVYGYPQKELAEKFGLSVSAVKQRCLQIRKKINKKLNDN